MNFRPRTQEQPDINLIPFIDILLVVIIFLMLTTTYSKYSELQLTLPTANAEQLRDRPKEIVVAVGADGRYAVNKVPLEGKSPDVVARALQAAANTGKDTVVIISADAVSPHQAVVTVMEAARRVGLLQVTFATQKPAGAP